MIRVSIDHVCEGGPVGPADRVLGVVGLSDDAGFALGLPAIGAAVREVWRVDRPVERRGVRDGVAFASAGGVVFATLQRVLAAGDTERAVRIAYENVFDLIDEIGCPHLLRVSNYVADIGAIEDGRERYWAFNAGRRDAFASRRRGAADAPAACGMGSGGDSLRLFFLAGDAPGINIENPRQVSAFDYPADHGPSAPLFARATVAAGLLMVSGTASIVGHRSLHVGDAAGQTDEIVRNIDAILDRAGLDGAGGRVTRQALRAKVYLRHVGDQGIVQARLRSAGFPAPVAWLQSDICRRELDVEIEAHAPCPD